MMGINSKIQIHNKKIIEKSVYTKDKFEGNLARQVSSLHLIRKTWNLIHSFKVMTFSTPFPLKGKY